MRTNMAKTAMLYARIVHAKQKRKYTGVPYFDHLAEVAGMVASSVHASPDAIATAWLHDVIEDHDIPFDLLKHVFGDDIADGVLRLTEIKLKGQNRAARKQATIARLSLAPGWVQTIKVADLLSNTSSIVEHDPAFARVYLREAAALADKLDAADIDLYGELKVTLAAESARLAT